MAYPFSKSPALHTLVPGVVLCLLVTGAASALESAEHAAFGRAWLESLVLAILAGAVVRMVWSPGRRWFAGHCILRADGAGNRGRAAGRIGQRGDDRGGGPGDGGRHRADRGRRDCQQLYDWPRAAAQPAHGLAGGMRQFDLRQFRRLRQSRR